VSDAALTRTRSAGVSHEVPAEAFALVVARRARRQASARWAVFAEPVNKPRPAQVFCKARAGEEGYSVTNTA
jgi:hypothetical protein